MELLINQLNNFTIEETGIHSQATHLEQLVCEKSYHKRQLEMTDNILNEVDNMLNNITYVKKEKINNNGQAVTINEKIYLGNEKLPKIKGSTIKIRFTTTCQKNMILTTLVPSYKDYKIIEEKQYIELINRKNGKG